VSLEDFLFLSDCVLNFCDVLNLLQWRKLYAIPNFPKITKKWRSTRTLEITKYLFRLGNRPESSVKSSECRALKFKPIISGHKSVKFSRFQKEIWNYHLQRGRRGKNSVVDLNVPLRDHSNNTWHLFGLHYITLSLSQYSLKLFSSLMKNYFSVFRC